MKRLFLICVLFPLFIVGLNAQKIDDKSVLLTVGKDVTTRGDFLKNYMQNAERGKKNPDRADLENYLQLFINFRLKVVAAKDAGYDTIRVLQDELANYRAQFAKPYLQDQKLAEQLYEEAYERLRYNIGARHILIGLDKYAKPADTLEAYKKAMEVRKKLIAGADFCDMVIKYSADFRRPKGSLLYKKTGYEGRLPYITGMSMVYPFEQALYDLKVGEISMPVRTKYGYHLIQMLDKHPALGKVQFSHIMAQEMPGDTSQRGKKKMDAAYEELKKGADYADVVSRYSEDRATIARGGVTHLTKLDRMLPEVVEQLFRLKEGEYSKPFRSRMGWHIVRLDEKAGLDSYENTRPVIVYSFDNDEERGMIPVMAKGNELLAECKWKVNQDVWKEVVQSFRDTVNGAKLPSDSLYNPRLFSKTLMVYEGKPVSVWRFMNFAKQTTKRDMVFNMKEWANDMLTRFINSQALIHEFSILETKYPEFAKMMSEYKDGIYLFDINNRRVWGKASDDSVGLAAYYEAHKDKYRTPRKVLATVFKYDVLHVNTKDMEKFVQKAYKGKWSYDRTRRDALDMFGEKCVRVDSAQYLAGKNQFVDKVEWKPGLSKAVLSGDDAKGFVWIHQVIPSRQYELEEVQGTVITDYQGLLEDEWVKELREKYQITINRDVFDSMLSK